MMSFNPVRRLLSCGIQEDLHPRRRRPADHADGKETQCLVDYSRGVLKRFDASWIFPQEFEGLVKVLIKYTVMFLTKLAKNFREGPQEHEYILRCNVSALPRMANEEMTCAGCV